MPRRGAKIVARIREYSEVINFNLKGPKMNENSEHDFDSIAELLRHQNVMLEILVHHLAGVEAAAFVLVLQTLPEEALDTVREVKDQILSGIHKRIIAEAERDFEDS